MFNIFCISKSSNIEKLQKYFDATSQEYTLTECFDYQRLTKSLSNAKNCDIVFVSLDTSALKNVVNQVYGLKSVVNIKLKNNYDKIKQYQDSISFSSSLLPEGFFPLRDDVYTPSFFGDIGFVKCYCLADRSEEIEAFCKLLSTKSLDDICKKNYCFKLFGLTAESIENFLKQFVRNGFKYYVNDDLFGDIALYLYFDDTTPVLIIDNIIKSIYAELSEAIYADFDTSLAEVFVHLASLANITVSFAESLTGGLVASKIVAVPNASKVLEQSFVTYSNSSKSALLNVSKKTIDDFGVVSHQVALEMAKGLLKTTQVGIAASTTGIAGPSGGSIKKPVGLVYCGIATESHAQVFENVFSGSRNDIRQKTANFVLFNLIKTIKNYL